ncbi:MAG: hypothetical protein F6K35_28600 [Okeania sp. SIO2H7]|nr:hypothetical protein [Okeania sp. SIO2H7]
MPQDRDYRIALNTGEYFADLLAIDAWCRGVSRAVQGSHLLCLKLQEREAIIETRLEHLAWKRGISVEDLKAQILRGEAERLKPDEIYE